MAGLAAAGGLTFLQSSSNRQAILSALTAGSSSWMTLGLTDEGLTIRNEMTIENGSGKTIKLHQLYLHWGKVKVPPAAVIHHDHSDASLFHAAGGWAISGSSGIVTYQLDEVTYLHIMWDCPQNYFTSDNFVGLYLCGESQKTPTGNLFKRMYQDKESKMTPTKGSHYDLVCCGPGDGTYVGNPGETGAKTWGVRRPCEVKNNQYFVTMTMGDRHATTSKVTILGKDFWPKFELESSVDLK